MTPEEEMERPFSVVAQPFKHHCPLPISFRDRRRYGIVLGTIVRCGECDQAWQFKDIGWEDSQKVWVRWDDRQ